jgi:hypothetical protein
MSDWLDFFLRGATAPRPPPLHSDRVKDLAARGLLQPRSLSEADIQELAAAVVAHLVAQRDPGAPRAP